MQSNNIKPSTFDYAILWPLTQSIVVSVKKQPTDVCTGVWVFFTDFRQQGSFPRCNYVNVEHITLLLLS